MNYHSYPAQENMLIRSVIFLERDNAFRLPKIKMNIAHPKGPSLRGIYE